MSADEEERRAGRAPARRKRDGRTSVVRREKRERYEVDNRETGKRMGGVIVAVEGNSVVACNIYAVIL